MNDASPPAWKAGDPIQYRRTEIPSFAVPPYEGERYETCVPDTLDLQERAAYAVNVLTEATDPDADYEIYWLTHVGRNPVVMQHDFSDHCQCKFMEALPLVRMISGSGQNEHVDRRWMEVLLRQRGDDGLLHTPLQGRPWATMNGEYYLGGVPAGDSYIDPFHNARSLTAIMLYHRRDGGDGPWAELARGIVDGLADLAIDKGKYAYFAPTCMCAIRGRDEDVGVTDRLVGAHVGFMVLALAHTHREIGCEPAMALAGKLVHYLRHILKYPDEQGRFEPGPRVHFHMHAYVLLSYVEYARASDDRELLQHARDGYEYAKAHGDALVGYFPELLHSDELEHSELCCVADMIAIAIKLTEAGVGDYMDDVDRWTRNMFAEGQLTPAKADWLRMHSERQPRTPWNAMHQTVERALERNIGAFAGWPKANDWYAGHAEGIMHCCTGNGSRTLYFIWKRILDFDAGALTVHLLLNRASPWADVNSHIPYAGQVDVHVKQAIDLAIRIPEWVETSDVRIEVQEDPREPEWAGRYARVGRVEAGRTVVMTFPIEETTQQVFIEKDAYTIVRKGNDIVALSPPGDICPIFNRPHYRSSGTRWRTIERFVSDEAPAW